MGGYTALKDATVLGSRWQAAKSCAKTGNILFAEGCAGRQSAVRRIDDQRDAQAFGKRLTPIGPGLITDKVLSGLQRRQPAVFAGSLKFQCFLVSELDFVAKCLGAFQRCSGTEIPATFEAGMTSTGARRKGIRSHENGHG